MPPKMHQNPKDSIEKERRVLLAIAAVKNHEIPSIREAARIFNISHTTLRRRLNGSLCRSETRANGHKLTSSEEESLVQWILSMDRRGAAPRRSHVQEMANIILSKRGTTPIQTFGVNWVYNLVKRHDELKTIYSQRYNHQRAKCEDPKIIREWFDRVQITIMQHGIVQEDIYNFDETGFAMGLVATAEVVTRAEMVGKPFLVQPGNQEWVTTIECINSSGWVLPPCIIFKGKTHVQGWYEDEDLPHDWRIEVSENGWTTDEIGLRWLKNVFIPSTEARTTGRYRLLVLDGHGSHLTPKFDEICSQNNIIPICMPPHSSHLLQPLHLACLSPLKQAYGRLVENKMRLGFNHIDKIDFLEAYSYAHTDIFKPQTIRNGFTATGLIPFNPERVLSQLNIQLETPTSPGGRSTNSAPKTPRNLHQLQKKDHRQSPLSLAETRLKKTYKGFEMALNEVILLAKEVHDLRAAHEKQLQKRKQSRRQIATAEGLSMQEGQQLLQHENEDQEAPNAQPTEPAPAAVEQRIRAPPRCSDCHIIGHRRLQCPSRHRN
ncbi:hypothetical protein MAP00_009287 [Monascus purpureus]|nr:hypothetical protein MAP00_009287 [Monascus purpureus]